LPYAVQPQISGAVDAPVDAFKGAPVDALNEGPTDADLGRATRTENVVRSISGTRHRTAASGHAMSSAAETPRRGRKRARASAHGADGEGAAAVPIVAAAAETDDVPPAPKRSRGTRGNPAALECVCGATLRGTRPWRVPPPKTRAAPIDARSRHRVVSWLRAALATVPAVPPAWIAGVEEAVVLGTRALTAYRDAMRPLMVGADVVARCPDALGRPADAEEFGDALRAAAVPPVTDADARENAALGPTAALQRDLAELEGALKKDVAAIFAGGQGMRCGRCGSSDVTGNIKGHSGDEAMKGFMTCGACGHKWKMAA
jgi:hypothetical protein